MRIKPIFRRYDFSIGVFIDTKQRVIYVFPLPMLGLQITLPQPQPHLLTSEEIWSQVQAEKRQREIDELYRF